jgi:aminoglycoside/choline kinase family phosphotransferase
VQNNQTKTSREDLISSFISNGCKITDFTIKKIAGDASFRSYYRIFKDGQADLILMDAPTQFEDIKPFIKIDEILRNNGFLAPEILAIDHENGFLLLQDFGDLSYSKALKNLTNQELEEKELDLYKKACDVLIELHKIPEPQNIPLYDEDLLTREVMLFIDWYLPNVTKKPATQEQIVEFKKLWIELFRKLSNDKKLVLRDYHADNLMVFEEKVALLDFQDAVLGSRAYDLVSLLEDARRDVGEKTVDAAIKHYLESSNCDKEQFLTDYQILSLQRNVKIIGIFARLAFRDNKESYLNFLPKMFKYVTIRLQDPIFSQMRDLFNNFDLKIK